MKTLRIASLKSRLTDIIHSLSLGRVLVLGDMAIDEMIYGQTARLSREAPVLILNHDHTDMLLGAASNAAHNLTALGAASARVAGVYGDDYHGPHLLWSFHQAGVNTDAMIADPQRPTTTKTRISGIANHSITQQIVRIDRESRQPLSPDIEAKLLDQVALLAPEVDAILLSDYALGVVTPGVIAACRQLCEQHQLVWTVDSQQPLSAFTGATIVTPNQPEAEASLGLSAHALGSVTAIEQYGPVLLQQAGTESVLITRGGSGMSLFVQDEPVCHIPVFNRSEVFDVTGAGDTVVATLTLALAAYRRQTGQAPDGAILRLAAVLGNLAASMVVRHFGVATTNQAELLSALDLLDVVDPALLTNLDL